MTDCSAVHLGFERYMLLVEAAMCIGAAIFFFICPAKFVQGLGDPLFVETPSVLDVMLSNMFQGRQTLLGAVALFAFIRNDPVLTFFSGCLFATWCLFFPLLLIKYFNCGVQRRIPDSTNVTMAALAFFFVLHIIGIVFQSNCL